MLRWILDKKGGWIALTLAAVALFVVVNVAAGHIVGMRADLTQDGLYTLSKGTRNILHKLQKPVQLTLYYSEDLGKTAPVYGNYAMRVKDMLRVIKATGGDKVALSIKDPKPFSETEDKAVALGLQGVPLDESGTKVYFGLAAKSGKKEIVIPFFDIEREKFLEYDIASLLYNVGTKHKPIVAVYTSRPLFGNIALQLRGLPSKPYAVIQQLEDHATVKQLYDLNDIWKIKPNVLMLVQPGKLSPKDYYNIDQYLLRGGKAMIFLDPFNETASLRRRSQFPERVTSRMDPLLKHWGIEMVKDRVVGDRRFARMVNAGDEKKIIPAPYLAWLSIRRSGLSQTDPITSQISLLNMESAGILEKKQNTSIQFEPLITSTPDSDQINTKLLDGAMPKILKILEEFKPSGKEQVIAARVSGRMKSMFPDGPPKEKQEKDKGAKKDKTTKKDEGAKKDKKSDALTGKASKPAAATKSASEEKSDSKSKMQPQVKADKAVRKVAQAESTSKEAAPKKAAPTATDQTKPAAATSAGEKSGEKTGAAAKPTEGKTEKKAEKKTDEKAKAPEKKAEKKPEAPPYVAESTAPMNVILVADADFLEDRFWVQKRNFFGQEVEVPFANNADFVVNAVENLAGGEDLIGLRSRGTAQRPFTKIAQLRLVADQKYRAEEQRLQNKLNDAEKKLAELDKKKSHGTSEKTVDKAVQTTASKFTEEVLTTRKALRKVQLALRENIENLEFWLKFINIALIPILVGVLAVVLGMVRMHRRKRHADTPAG